MKLRGKEEFWDQLLDMENSIQGPWLVFRDFNAISNSVDKQGGRPYASSTKDCLY